MENTVKYMKIINTQNHIAADLQLKGAPCWVADGAKDDKEDR